MIPPEIAPKPEFHSIRPIVMSAGGLVVAGTQFAAEAGTRALTQGGNAVDAAIAGAAVQAVVMPHMNGLGSDMFMLYRARDGKIHALNASGPAPQTATLAAFDERGLKSVPARGIEAVSVPGVVDGWFRALAKFGRLKPGQIFDRALGYAREGFPVYKNFIRYLASPPFQALRKQVPVLAAKYLDRGELPKLGARLAQPELAKTLERIVRGGADEYYRGETAALIARTSEKLGGFLALDDLSRYASEWVEPLSISYRGMRVYQLPPSSQGLTMLQQLKSVESFDLRQLGHNTPDYIHLLVEAKKAAFLDRACHVADPRFYRVPVEELLSSAKAETFRRNFKQSSGRGGVREGIAARPSGDTTCVVAADAEGNVAALIQSNFDEFGSGVFVEEAGFVLHDRMCGFTLEPGHPNALAPGKRPMHTLCSSLVERDGRFLFALETPGGHAQTQSLVQILHNLSVFGMDVQEAVEAPRFTHEGDQLLLESRLGSNLRAALAQRGHSVQHIPSWSSIAGGSAVLTIDENSGTRMGGADPRRDSYALPA